jgi:hypothetical protein
MKKLLWLLAIFPMLAQAEIKHVSWVNPTKYVDGSALAAADITQTDIEYGSCNGTAFGTLVGTVTASGNVTTYDVPLNPGQWCLRLYTTAKAAKSGPSAVVMVTIVQPAPNPPTSVTVNTTAWEIKPQNDLVKVAGSVPLGTECRTTTQTVNGVRYTELDPATVTFKPGNRPEQVWGNCETVTN